MRRFLPLLLLTTLPACATLVEGTSDTITVSTTPPGASCVIDRNGERVGAIPVTPGSIRLDKSRHDLDVSCTKPGFQPAKTVASPDFTGWTLGNLVVGGIVGLVVDAASGANDRYPPDIRLDLAASPILVPATPLAAQPAAPSTGPQGALISQPPTPPRSPSPAPAPARYTQPVPPR